MLLRCHTSSHFSTLLARPAQASYLLGLAQAFSNSMLSDASMTAMSDAQLLECLCKVSMFLSEAREFDSIKS